MSISNYLAKLVELKNQLVVNLRSMGVAADESEKLNTLVPKMLEVKGEQNVELIDNWTTETFTNAIKSIIVPEGVTSFGASLFGTNLKQVNLPSSLKSLHCTFEGSGIEELIIPEGVTYLYGQYFCKNCTSLKKVYIPSTITTISNQNGDIEYLAFYGCTSLEEVVFGEGFSAPTHQLYLRAGNYSVECMVAMFEALALRTATNPRYTLKLGSTNLGKLTAEQKAIATNKNWLLS